MKVLLTGATGFLGRHVLSALQSAGITTIATFAREPGPPGPFVTWLLANLREEGVARSLIQAHKPSHLLHMAWRPVYGNVSGARDNIDWIKASLDLASAFADSGGERIVGTGSCFEYDWADGVCTEGSTPLAPSTFYGASKDSLRAALTGLARESGVSFAWPRVFFTYGPGENETRFVTSLVTAMLSGAAAEMTSGVQLRDFVYAGDVAEALTQLLQSDLEGAYNIGTGSPVRLLDIANEVANQTGRQDLLRIGARTPKGYEPPLIVADMAKTSAALGWRARTPLRDGIAQTIEATRRRLQATA